MNLTTRALARRSRSKSRPRSAKTCGRGGTSQSVQRQRPHHPSPKLVGKSCAINKVADRYQRDVESNTPWPLIGRDVVLRLRSVIRTVTTDSSWSANECISACCSFDCFDLARLRFGVGRKAGCAGDWQLRLPEG